MVFYFVLFYSYYILIFLCVKRYFVYYFSIYSFSEIYCILSFPVVYHVQGMFSYISIVSGICLLIPQLFGAELRHDHLRKEGTSMNQHSQNMHMSLQDAHGELPYGMTNDYVFRAVLQSNNKVLRGLICSLLQCNPEQQNTDQSGNAGHQPAELAESLRHVPVPLL